MEIRDGDKVRFGKTEWEPEAGGEKEKFGWERVGDKGGVEERIEVGKERVIPDEESLDLVN